MVGSVKSQEPCLSGDPFALLSTSPAVHLFIHHEAELQNFIKLKGTLKSHQG